MSPRPTRVTPHELGIDWPHAPIDDRVAEVARLLVLNLLGAIGDRSVREVAVITGVDRATIGAIIKGMSWPDIATLAKLEIGLGRQLWPVDPALARVDDSNGNEGNFLHGPYVRGQFLPRKLDGGESP